MLYAIVVVLLLIADQGLKYWVTVHVALNEGRYVLIPHLLDVMNIHNYGIAFSWLQNVPSWVFALIALVFAAVVIIALRRGMIHGRFGRWMAVIALAGAIGNLIDRVLSGYVVDMLAFSFWKSFPVFNIADACLVVGGIAFCLYAIFHKEPEQVEAAPKKTRARAAARSAERTEKPARAPRAEKAAAEKPALGAVLSEKRAAVQKAVAEKQQKAAETRRAAAEEKRAAAAETRAAAQAAPKPAAAEDPFAAWDRAVSEQDARAKADQERRAQLRAEREKQRAAEAAKAQSVKPAAQPAADDDVKTAPPPKKPVVDDAPTRKVAAQKIDEMAAKLAPKQPETAPAPKQPEPAPAPKQPVEEPVSYDLEDILAEFRDI